MVVARSNCGRTAAEQQLKSDSGCRQCTKGLNETWQGAHDARRSVDISQCLFVLHVLANTPYTPLIPYTGAPPPARRVPRLPTCHTCLLSPDRNEQRSLFRLTARAVDGLVGRWTLILRKAATPDQLEMRCTERTKIQ